MSLIDVLIVAVIVLACAAAIRRMCKQGVCGSCSNAGSCGGACSSCSAAHRASCPACLGADEVERRLSADITGPNTDTSDK